jgi:hypothetical protein
MNRRKTRIFGWQEMACDTNCPLSLAGKLADDHTSGHLSVTIYIASGNTN